jgi:sortase B
MSYGRKILLVICLIVFVGSAGTLANYYLKGIRAQNAFEDLGSLKNTETADLKTDKGIVIGKYVDLYLANDDIVGWVKIEDTNIDYPVMQTLWAPEYYLDKNFEEDYMASGTPFMDAHSDIFVPTSNFLIYGHHMKDGTMFHDLLKYDDYEFYQTHKTFQFDTIYKGGQGTYEVIAAGYSQIFPVESTRFKYYKYAGITSESEFNEYVEGVQNIAEYETGVTAEYGDQLVTLSTCAYHVKDGRFFVVGKRID